MLEIIDEEGLRAKSNILSSNIKSQKQILEFLMIIFTRSIAHQTFFKFVIAIFIFNSVRIFFLKINNEEIFEPSKLGIQIQVHNLIKEVLRQLNRRSHGIKHSKYWLICYQLVHENKLIDVNLELFLIIILILHRKYWLLGHPNLWFIVSTEYESLFGCLIFNMWKV